MSTRILIWGASGHAKVIRPILASAHREVVAVVERNPIIAPPFPSVPVLQDEAEVQDWAELHGRECEYVLAIGGHNGAERHRLAVWLEQFGMRPFTPVHRTAFVANTATIGEGSHILPLAAICEEAYLGPQTIINTRASVDHESRLGFGVHIMPGATITGCVKIDDYATVGAGATVLPRISIGKNALIGAGAVVVEDVLPGSIVAGVPAKPLERA